jgi:thiosulfate/3-mercaptopyruvate sulfurtransferase
MPTPENFDPLVTTDWLAEHLGDPNVRVVDMRGYVSTRPVAPGVEEATYQGASKEYHAEHIPGSVYIDWTRDIVDPDDPVPAQIAPPERFAVAMGTRGIDASTHVIAVDHKGGQFATRLWWALMYYGHDRVSVLDGGFSRWVAEGRPVNRSSVAVETRSFVPKIRPDWRITAESLRDALPKAGASFQLIDARDEAQFTARKRRGLRGGHIPGAVNVPRETFVAEGGSGGFRPLPEIEAGLKAQGIDPKAPVVAYCNGGVAATVPLFHLNRLGNTQLTNYDGSWNEWGDRPDLPAEPETPATPPGTELND